MKERLMTGRLQDIKNLRIFKFWYDSSIEELDYSIGTIFTPGKNHCNDKDKQLERLFQREEVVILLFATIKFPCHQEQHGV